MIFYFFRARAPPISPVNGLQEANPRRSAVIGPRSSVIFLFIQVSQDELQAGDDGDSRRLGPKNPRSQADGPETCYLSLPGFFIGKTSLGTDENDGSGRMGHGLPQA